ncbi:MAG: hypothetical protein ACPG4Z_05255 [Chitinophagales bacterium]
MDWKEKWDLVLALLEHIDVMIFVKNILISLLVSAIASITAVIIFRKYILAERRHWSLKILSYVWLIGIPIFAIYTGFKYGAINAIHKNVEQEITIQMEELSSILSESIGDEWASALTTGEYACEFCEDNLLLELTPANALDVGVLLVFDEYSQILQQLENHEKPILQKIGLVLTKTIQVKIVSWAVKKGIEKLLEKAGLSPDIADEMLDTKMNELLEGGILAKIISIQLGEIFGGLKKSTLLLFFGLLLLPVGEIAYAHYWLRSQKSIEQQ